MELLVLLWIGCAVLSGTVARSKGRDAASWALIGFLFGPLGVLAAVGMGPATASTVGTVRCRACRSVVDPAATICPHCRTDNPVTAEERDRSASELRGQLAWRWIVAIGAALFIAWCTAAIDRP